MTKIDRLKAYESFFHRVNAHCITMNTEKVTEAVSLISAWSYAHREGNGEHSEHRQKKMVESVIQQMNNFR